MNAYNDQTDKGFFKGACLCCGESIYKASKRGQPAKYHKGACADFGVALSALESAYLDNSGNVSTGRWAALRRTVLSRAMSTGNRMQTPHVSDSADKV